MEKHHKMMYEKKKKKKEEEEKKSLCGLVFKNCSTIVFYSVT
jgi:hypothetical protein